MMIRSSCHRIFHQMGKWFSNICNICLSFIRNEKEIVVTRIRIQINQYKLILFSISISHCPSYFHSWFMSSKTERMFPISKGKIFYFCFFHSFNFRQSFPFISMFSHKINNFPWNRFHFPVFWVLSILVKQSNWQVVFWLFLS